VTRHGIDRNQTRPLYLSDYGEKVLLDSDLAHLYCVATSSLKEQAKRTITRFPDEVAFGSILKS
jgi:ORF6N domain